MIRTLERALAGVALDPHEALPLFAAEGPALADLVAVADEVRRRRTGDVVHFVVNRNINFTNVCNVGCRFCGFARREGSPEAELLPNEEVVRRAEEAWDRGATEVCIQGGLHPRIGGEHYASLVRAVKERVPAMHCHAFSPFEIKYGAGKLGVSHEDFLRGLKDAGLDTIPGTAAEILDTDVRRTLTRNKLSADEWESIVRTAHRLGIRSTATMMYGHVDAPEHWVSHIARLRAIQRDTGGFTEFVPLGFVHWGAPIYVQGDARPGPTRDEHIKVHAIARLMLQGWIDHIQVSWVKLGPRLAQYLLRTGADDMGGTLMNESISRSAGAPWGQEVTPAEFCRLIREVGRVPAQRDTLYRVRESFADRAPPDRAPLVTRNPEQTAAIGG